MAGERILVVDDEEDLLELVNYNLSKEGYRVACVSTGEAAINEARNTLPDVVVLDLLLPHVDGLNVCKTLKGDPRTQHIPVIMLTAKSEEADVVTGLELGADDYITKPFGVAELIARVRAVLRRTSVLDSIPIEPSFTSGDLLINFVERKVIAAGSEVRLTPTEYSLLKELALNAGKVLTYASF